MSCIRKLGYILCLYLPSIFLSSSISYWAILLQQHDQNPPTVNPPSAVIILLFIYPLVANNATIDAISSGLPSRPIGILLRSASVLLGIMTVSSIKAGAMAFVVCHRLDTVKVGEQQ